MNHLSSLIITKSKKRLRLKVEGTEKHYHESTRRRWPTLGVLALADRRKRENTKSN
jgi:hypothetical protein